MPFTKKWVMLTDQPDFSNSFNRLYHVSEEPGIELFEPRPSPSFYEQIAGDVVFAISETMLHNYLLPRNCPRVTFYAAPSTTIADSERFIGASSARYFITVDAAWYSRIKAAQLYLYEFPAGNFILLDECAGYYISYQTVKPVSVTQIDDVIAALLSRNVELRFTPSLVHLAKDIAGSTLNFSNIRLRNAM